MGTSRRGACSRVTIVGLVALGLAGCEGSGARALERPVIFDREGAPALDPTEIAKYQAPLVIPPVMPRDGVIHRKGGRNIDYYEIAVRQFTQQVLPPGLPATTVWGYGAEAAPATFNYPSFTIEARWRRPVRVKWVNGLVDREGRYLPHLLPVDQTLHWANPMRRCMGGVDMTDCRGDSQLPYRGPVPIVTHVHGAETTEWSDGYPEAWYLPAAVDLPAGISSSGSLHSTFAAAAAAAGIVWEPGSATFEYPNDMRAATLWYHDHTIGMTRLNVYAGPAGFFLLRGGPGDEVLDSRTGLRARLPGPAPRRGDRGSKRYREIPIGIQDRSFLEDGSLAYPDNRAFFEGRDPSHLRIPFIPDLTLDGEPSDISPIWNPEFFGNTIVVNGRTWPYLAVEPRRYRLRLLNGMQSRFLILALSSRGSFWQLGAEGGFLPAPVERDEILLGPAERADVIVDFAGLPVGTTVTLLNRGPDEPFGGGEPDVDFPSADPDTTGQVMRFVVVPMTDPFDDSTPPEFLRLPRREPLPGPSHTRKVSLNEVDSDKVFVIEQPDGSLVEVPAETAGAAEFGPEAALLGTIAPDGSGEPLDWRAGITETPAAGTVEEWELHNFTEDAHPIHIHLVQFEVVGREVMGDPTATSIAGSNLPLSGETGTKDTVIAYPGEITRVKAFFQTPGLFVWHCHILEHEDNEMMRPYCVGSSPGCRRAAELATPHSH